MKEQLKVYSYKRRYFIVKEQYKMVRAWPWSKPKKKIIRSGILLPFYLLSNYYDYADDNHTPIVFRDDGNVIIKYEYPHVYGYNSLTQHLNAKYNQYYFLSHDDALRVLDFILSFDDYKNPLALNTIELEKDE